MKYLYLLFGLLLFIGFVYAENFFGLNGRQLFDYSKYNNISIDDIPAEYKDLCEKHMNAMIERCKNSGYENWFVTRLISGKKFSENKYFGAEDMITGSEKCSYYENSIDEVLVSSVILNFSCSESKEGINTRSDEYLCEFSCSAWDCDPNVEANEIGGCAINPKKAEAGFFGGLFGSKPDPFELQSQDCRESMEELCAYNGPNCKLEKPCYLKEIAGKPSDVVFCKCSCPNKLLEENFSLQEWQSRKRETIDLDSFSLEEWKRSHANCNGEKTVLSKPDASIDLEGLKKKVNDQIKSIPKDALKIVGDGEVSVKVEDSIGRDNYWKAKIGNGTIKELSAGEAQKPVIVIASRQNVIDSIQNSFDKENALKFALKNNFIKINFTNPLTQTAADAYKATLDGKPATAKINETALFNGQKGTVQAAGKGKTIISIPGQKFVPVINSFGSPIGYTTQPMNSILNKTSLSFSSKAGIIALNPVNQQMLVKSPSTTKISLQPQIIVGGKYSSADALKSGAYSAKSYSSKATVNKTMYVSQVSYSGSMKASAGGAIAYRIR